MRAFIAICVMCAEVAHASVAAAEPRPSVCDDYNLAKSLEDRGDYESARASIERGLATAHGECRIRLLGLQGAVLVELREYAEALAAYQACLDAGATGARRREAQQAIGILQPVKSTFIDITLDTGSAAIYLDSETYGVFCRAAPTCHKAILPGDYTVIAIAERRGFERWTGSVTAVTGRPTPVPIALVESPSLLTVRVTPPGARVTVDGTPQGAPTRIAPGVHRVAVSLAGYAGAEREVIAHEGEPIELDVPLVPLVPVRGAPPGAQLTLDGEPIAIDRGSIALPPGPHALVASARGYRAQHIDIPALRPSDYRIAVELQPVELAAPAPGGFTLRRKLALAGTGVAAVATAVGTVLGVQALHLDDRAFALCASPAPTCPDALKADDLNLRARSRALDANIAFGIAGGAAITAAALWLTGAPDSRVAVIPHLGAVAGIDLAASF